MKEADFQKRVTDMAERFGWKWWHVPSPMVADGKGGWRPYKKAAGLPDLFLMHDDPPRLIIAEVKGDGGKLSDAQREFLQAAKAVADRTWQEPTEYALDDISPAIVVATGHALGVYVFDPSMEAAVEQMLRTKVLT